MPNYRRARVRGATFFFTVVLAERDSSLLTERIEDLRRAYVATTATMPVHCDAMVVLPDHMHAVWTLPQGDGNYSERWRKIKFRFSRAVGCRFPRSASKIAKRETGIWQRRFWEHTIRDETEFAQHVDYIHYNPVKHGLVGCPKDWPFSTIHRYVANGAYPSDWCCPKTGPMTIADHLIDLDSTGE